MTEEFARDAYRAFNDRVEPKLEELEELTSKQAARMGALEAKFAAATLAGAVAAASGAAATGDSTARFVDAGATATSESAAKPMIPAAAAGLFSLARSVDSGASSEATVVSVMPAAAAAQFGVAPRGSKLPTAPGAALGTPSASAPGATSISTLASNEKIGTASAMEERLLELEKAMEVLRVDGTALMAGGVATARHLSINGSRVASMSGTEVSAVSRFSCFESVSCRGRGCSAADRPII